MRRRQRNATKDAEACLGEQSLNSQESTLIGRHDKHSVGLAFGLRPVKYQQYVPTAHACPPIISELAMRALPYNEAAVTAVCQIGRKTTPENKVSREQRVLG
jgi:hypothetical protein